AIASFPDFVEIETYFACVDYFREKHPQRWRLKSLLRRRLRQNPRFALWQAEDQRWYASFSARQETGSEAEESDSSDSVSHPTAGKLSDAQLKSDEFMGEVCQLPVLQRAALLLNLRDSRDGGVISFLPFLGVASKEELARLLEMPYEDFQKLWSELPLDDSRIAQMFGITRQQVINLRKTARERLVRRTRRLDAK